ncbi:MAG TPA: alpha-ketoglutarate-dependent dioxygenase AlkB [Prolixibacteraceae bacterium]|nr:alpha-ketoglutarate-dependent dioxygenase AlkB [Prolixibacteraceae bacterium]
MSQFNLFDPPLPAQDAAEPVVLQNGEYIHIPHFFNAEESDHFFRVLREKVDWKQESMNMYGRRLPFPRLIAWYGDDKKPFSFSGVTLDPVPWLPELLEMKKRLEPVARIEFNRVLLNLYRDGRDSVGWHTDAEPGLGKNPVIASVSFGATRKFQLRHMQTKEKVELELTHGSLLIMRGEMQHFWQHQVPKTAKTVGERINLTFRVMK